MTGVVDGVTIRHTVKINQKFNFQATGSVFGKTKNLYLLVVPSFLGGTSPTTLLGQINVNTLIKYTDA